MQHLQHKISSKAGLPPGSLVHIGDRLTEKFIAEVILYDEDGMEGQTCEDFKDLVSVLENSTKNKWINITGLHDIKQIEAIGDYFKLHPLLLEDVLNTEQRPKADIYEEHLLFSLKMMSDFEDSTIKYEQLSLVLGSDYVISFQERQGDLFDPIRHRIGDEKSKIRKSPVDYLFYRLLDVIVDSYYNIVEKIGDTLEKMETEILEAPTENSKKTLLRIKKELIFFRKSVFPVREALMKITKEDGALIDPSTQKYFRDIHDHTVFVIETLESYRELSSHLMETYMASINNRMNEVMKMLTMIATIFIPLTFIAGIYGMNFQHMPELEWKWAYPAILIIMAAIMVAMMVYFKRKGWW